MTEQLFPPTDWIIAFFGDEAVEKRWWHVFTKPGFRHCFAFRYLVKADMWVAVDWSNTGLSLGTIPKEAVDIIIIAVNQSGGAFLEILAKPQERRAIPPLPLYCVTAVKELVGLRDWRVVTPWQLYCALLRRGARRMFDLNYVEENVSGQPIQETEGNSAER